MDTIDGVAGLVGIGQLATAAGFRLGTGEAAGRLAPGRPGWICAPGVTSSRPYARNEWPAALGPNPPAGRWERARRPR